MNNRRCNEPDCDKVHRARGFCRYHYHKYRRLGMIPESFQPCQQPGCDRAVVALNVCQAHYARILKGSEVPSYVPIMTPTERTVYLHKIRPDMRNASRRGKEKDNGT